MGDDGLAGLVNPAIHAHNQLVLETSISVQEEVVEMDLKRLEKRLRNLVLDRGWQFFVEVKLFDNQIEVIDESILDEFLDGVVQFVWNLFLTVAVFEPQ